MNHYVPDFEIEEDSVRTPTRSKKSSMADEEIMELLWQNGQVVAQSQNPRFLKKSDGGAVSEQREIRLDLETAVTNNQLFIQEDEMSSWLHYPLEDSSLDRDFYADLLYQPSSSAPIAATVSGPTRQDVATANLRPPVPQLLRQPNFSLFSRSREGIDQSGPSTSNKARKESTIVDSNNSPLAINVVSCVTDNAVQVNRGCSAITAAATPTESSSPGGSAASISAGSAEPSLKPTTTAGGATTTVTDNRRRKGRESAADDSECQSEDVEYESARAKKQARGSTSTKRSRAAEVHNLSERRRRDRINEKMKALQELIPRCNKTDKASMLDEAIEYLKTLQMQVQMLSMGCGMVPMMFPGVQQYMPSMAMGMGMGIDMGMSRTMVPFPSVLPGAALQNQAAAAQFAPRFPMTGFHMPSQVPPPDASRIQVTNQPDVMPTPLASQLANQARMPTSLPDQYQQYLGLHHAQAQNRPVVQHTPPSKPNGDREDGNPGTSKSG